jgi:hypothetical protein
MIINIINILNINIFINIDVHATSSPLAPQPPTILVPLCAFYPSIFVRRRGIHFYRFFYWSPFDVSLDKIFLWGRATLWQH